jgi:signal transduction histidine kinase/CheY-like chemotaxis protein
LFSIVSLLIVSWLITISRINIDRSNSRIDQTYEIIIALQHAQSSPSLLQVPAGLQQARPGLPQDLDSLQQLTQNNSDQQENLALLHSYILHPASDTAIRSLLNKMIRQERGLLATRKKVNEDANRRVAFGLIIGRLAGFLFVVIILFNLNKDISRRKKTQEQLVIAMQEAQEARQMQEQFLANMSHEIRTPMNGIKGMTDLLLSTPLSDKQQELAGIIKSAVNNLLVIVGDILDFSKIKAGKLNIEKIDFRVKDVLNNATAIFEHRLKKKKLALKVEIDPAIPVWLTGDPHRLNQVLTNLLGNAIKFTDHGQIHIQVTRQHQSPGEESEQVLLSFTISDTGIGIPPDSLPYIFDSFAQAGQDISRLYGGTGLGLTICKQLLHLQGGDIAATSTFGEGSVFRFYLPYGYSEGAVAMQPSTDTSNDYSQLLMGKRFLVAEDNEINQKVIDYVLRRAGGTVELFNNGADAIKYLQQDQVFDLIIMDLQMPEMDGYATTRFIRNDLRILTPIIAMTATAMKGEQLQCIESGMNEYMTKPFEFAELYKRISGLLS